MNYVESLNILGLEARQRPCLTGSGKPTTVTVGTVGELYIDEDSGSLYKCVAEADGVYTWEDIVLPYIGNNSDLKTTDKTVVGAINELKIAIDSKPDSNGSNTDDIKYTNLLETIASEETVLDIPSIFPCKKSGIWFDYRNGGSFKANENTDCYIFEASSYERFCVCGLTRYATFDNKYIFVAVNSEFEILEDSPATTDFLRWCTGTKACPENTSYIIVNVAANSERPTITNVGEQTIVDNGEILLEISKCNVPQYIGTDTLRYYGVVGETLKIANTTTADIFMHGVYILENNVQYTVDFQSYKYVPRYYLLDKDYIVTAIVDNDGSTKSFIGSDSIKYIAVNCTEFPPEKATSGVKWVAYGDSITNHNMWQPHIISRYGIAKYVNLGRSGAPLGGTGSSSMCNDTFLSALVAENPDVITILGGANDLMQDATGIEIGTNENFEDMDKTTFKGAYAYIINYILTNLPSCKICLMGMFRAAYDNGKENPTNGETVTVTYDDYNTATKEVADYFCLPFVDLNECGFNAYTFNNTANTVLSKPYDYIHPNEEGGKRIAAVVDNFFRSMY